VFFHVTILKLYFFPEQPGGGGGGPGRPEGVGDVRDVAEVDARNEACDQLSRDRGRRPPQAEAGPRPDQKSGPVVRNSRTIRSADPDQARKHV
jgi:hypothetical protein